MSFSPPLLPENNSLDVGEANAGDSKDSSISEHILSNEDSLENDRSFQEIFVDNTPSKFDLILEKLGEDGRDERLSQEVVPSPMVDSESFRSEVFNLSGLGKIGEFNDEIFNYIQCNRDNLNDHDIMGLYACIYLHY